MVHSVILCNRMIPHMFNVHSQPSCSVIDIYINAHMIIIMINAIFWDYYPISIDIIHYTYGYYFSPQRVMYSDVECNFMELKEDDMGVLPCDMRCAMCLCMLFMDV